MKYFIEFVVGALVDRRDEVDVAELTSGDVMRFVIRVHPEDIGKVIGRNGRTITAIRNVAGAAVSRTHKRVVIDVEHPVGSTPA